ncbi:MAG: hypothetical protein ACJAXJ_004447 [Colwellia sp.]|jgi:hypothetical protein
MFTVLMIYLVVAVVIFVAALISEILSPDPGREYSGIAILAQCVAAAVSWPLIVITLIILQVGNWFFLPRKGKGSMGGTCGFCNAYYYRQMPGYTGPDKVWVKHQKEGEESEPLAMPEWMNSSKSQLDK